MLHGGGVCLLQKQTGSRGVGLNVLTVLVESHDKLHVWAVASSVTKHTHKRHSAIWELVCVCLLYCLDKKPTKTSNRFKPINGRKRTPLPVLTTVTFLIYWFISWSVLVSLWTSKPLGGALYNMGWFCPSFLPIVSSSQLEMYLTNLCAIY